MFSLCLFLIILWICLFSFLIQNSEKFFSKYGNSSSVSFGSCISELKKVTIFTSRLHKFVNYIIWSNVLIFIVIVTVVWELYPDLLELSRGMDYATNFMIQYFNPLVYCPELRTWNLKVPLPT